MDDNAKEKKLSGEVLLSVKDLHKTFGKLHVLKGVSEEIRRGEVVFVIGPSGSGKSTFLRCLNLLEVPESGSIIFEGSELLANDCLLYTSDAADD